MSQRAEARSEAARPLLSLVMIVKDEEDFLPGALDSALGWVDEIVVVDTGSSDRSVEIARSRGARVSFFPWTGSFSEARNESIRQARGDWVAILDADERFVSPEPGRIREHLVPSGRHPYQALMLKVVNRQLDGSATHSFFSPRIFPRHENIGYEGRIHNNFGALDGSEPPFDFIRCFGLEIDHLGYDPVIYQKKEKLARNLELLERAAAEEPEVPRYRFYLGREYVQAQRPEEGLELLRALFAEGPEGDPFLYIETGTQILDTLDQLRRAPEERLAIATALIELQEDELDSWYFLGRTFLELHEEQSAEDAFRVVVRLLQERDLEQLQVCRVAHLQEQLYRHLATLSRARGEHATAAADEAALLAQLPEESPERAALQRRLTLEHPELLERALVQDALDALLKDPARERLLPPALPRLEAAHPRLLKGWLRRNRLLHPWL